MTEASGKALRLLTAQFSLGEIDLPTYRERRAALLDSLVGEGGRQVAARDGRAPGRSPWYLVRSWGHATIRLFRRAS